MDVVIPATESTQSDPTLTMNAKRWLAISLAAVLPAWITSCNATVVSPHPIPPDSSWLTYPGGQGPGAGKHIVLIAADQEYRSEQSLPMLARTLSEHHGFHCTVLFSVNDEGLVDPTKKIRWEDKQVIHDTLSSVLAQENETPLTADQRHS